MRLEWIDDILAVLDGGSLARAAEKRLLTQSAFTRRVRIIEDSIGATLFDRRRKPVTLMPGVRTLEPELRDLSARLHKLRHSMKTASDQAAKSLGFVCQHALTTTVSPQVVLALSAEGQVSTRVRSGNQDECLMHLISREVDFAIMYALPGDETPESGNAFEAVILGTDTLIPVATPNVRNKVDAAVLPTISYPSEVFLGQVFARMINPRLPKDTTVSTVAETALTLAMLQLVLKDIGVAWLPQSLIGDHLSQGRLVRIDDVLPSQPLIIRLVRLSETQPEHAERIWQHLTQYLQLRTLGD
ncbi:LysR family transcriptional regulator [Shimia marina]|uniref:Quorum-sensing regulator protein D n=1 Tax=Shimia marina TaxID=321267 RepID=A0A0P1ELF5_9RHOB|nr:LysR family transcriptional regulator [Shimia marina]CUH51160.1 Quorum-sensing regulator protein D [Shimia marina]SFD56424.1 DNA-binding transcriptional regulator, LysR family [Shimia marina]